jgi:YbbR domain-containing protein
MTSTASFTVTASAPTDAAQLTTTFSIDAQAATQTTDNNNNNNNNNNSNNNNDDDDDDDDDSAAVGVSAPLYLAGALVAGAMAFFI